MAGAPPHTTINLRPSAPEASEAVHLLQPKNKNRQQKLAIFAHARLAGAGHELLSRSPSHCRTTKYSRPRLGISQSLNKPAAVSTRRSSRATIKYKNDQQKLIVFVLARLTGADPATSRVTGECSTVELQPQVRNKMRITYIFIFSERRGCMFHTAANFSDSATIGCR